MTLWPSEIYVYSAILLLALCSVLTDLLPWKAGLGPVFDYKLVAGLVAILVFLRTRSAVLVIVVGMLVLWGLRWLAG